VHADVVVIGAGQAGLSAAYALHRPVAVRSVSATDDGFRLDTSEGEWTARGIVNATGTWTRPFWPAYPGRAVFAGRQLHAADYRGAEEFRDRHMEASSASPA
jgi:cation diffusion facilitator CzcD-associated flavoprotein CzcO